MTNLSDKFVIIDGAGDMHKGILTIQSKTKIKELIMDLIGEDEDLYISTDKDTFKSDQRTIGRNQHRNDLREKVEAL